MAPTTVRRSAPRRSRLLLPDIGANLIDDPGAGSTNCWSGRCRLQAVSQSAGCAGAVIAWLAAAVATRWLIHRFGKGLMSSLRCTAGPGRRSHRRWSISNLAGNAAFWIILAYA